MKIPIYIVVGTRAQLIKTAPVMLELDKRGINYSFIYTAQHFETIDEIRKEFGLKQPDIVVVKPEETKTLGLFGKWFIKAFWKLFRNRKNFIPQKGLLITHGDTTSCVWGALLGKLTGCKVMHLESGLRSFNIFKPFPEELNRLITFQLTDIYVCPNKWALNNLRKHKGIKINTRENTLYDAVNLALNAQFKPNNIKLPKKHIVASIHRFEHIFNKKKLKKIVELVSIAADKYPVIFILHPVTKKQLKKTKLLDYLVNNKRIIISDRLSFFRFITLINRSEFVITDGGSNQEELSYLGKPTIILREVTERIEGLGKNALLIELDENKFKHFLDNYQNYKRPKKVVKTSPSKIIVDWIEAYIRKTDYRVLYEDRDYVEKYRKKRGEGRLEFLVSKINFSSADEVLDVGCGNGMLYELIRNKVKKYVGIDISKAFIKECLNAFKKENRCSFFVEDTKKHLRRKVKYDKIFLFDVVEHVPNKEVQEMFRDIKALLKRNGRLYIHTPNADFFIEVLKKIGVVKQTPGHIAVRDGKEYVSMLKRAGFKHINLRYIPHYNKKIKLLHIFSYIPIVGRFFKARLFIEAKNQL